MTKRDRWDWAALLAAIALCALALLLTGCASMGTRQMQSVETQEGIVEGKPTRLVIKRREEEQEQAKAGVDPAAIEAMIATAVKAAVPGADAIAALIPKPPPTKILGMDPETAAGVAGAIWAGERGVSAYHKRRRLKPESKPT